MALYRHTFVPCRRRGKQKFLQGSLTFKLLRKEQIECSLIMHQVHFWQTLKDLDVWIPPDIVWVLESLKGFLKIFLIFLRAWEFPAKTVVKQTFWKKSQEEKKLKTLRSFATLFWMSSPGVGWVGK